MAKPAIKGRQRTAWETVQDNMRAVMKEDNRPAVYVRFLLWAASDACVDVCMWPTPQAQRSAPATNVEMNERPYIGADGSRLACVQAFARAVLLFGGGVALFRLTEDSFVI